MTPQGKHTPGPWTLGQNDTVVFVNRATNIRYGKPGTILFDYAGTTYTAKEPMDVLLVGWPGAEKWIEQNWLKPLFALKQTPQPWLLATGAQSALPPMQQRYFERKAQLPAGTVLVMRLGDFYEVFGDDVPRVCKVLNIAQTKRGSIVMCGVPYHAAGKYIGQLEQAGIAVETMEVQP